jgi:hypothetical protein
MFQDIFLECTVTKRLDTCFSELETLKMLVLLLFLVLPPWALAAPQEARGIVAAQCKFVDAIVTGLHALPSATAFCSSFLHISTVTSTATSTLTNTVPSTTTETQTFTTVIITTISTETVITGTVTSTAEAVTETSTT